MTGDLLPHNATAQERALSDSTARLDEVPAPIRDIWNADTCPPNLLAWLAWAFSVDEWDGRWTDAQKREFVKRSVEIHRRKGTIGALKDALAALEVDVQVQEWFAQEPAGAPFTFRVLLEADQTGFGQEGFASLFEVIMRTKNLRSHLSEIALTVRSVTGPRIAAVACVGTEITLVDFRMPPMIVTESAICF